MSIPKPTAQQLSNAWLEETDDFELVREESDPSWRHGCYMTWVFKRLEDGTFWSTSGTQSGDNEHNSLREAECSDPVQVWPHTVETTVYRPQPPKEALAA